MPASSNPFTAERERRRASVSDNPFTAERQRRQQDVTAVGAGLTAGFTRMVNNALGMAGATISGAAQATVPTLNTPAVRERVAGAVPRPRAEELVAAAYSAPALAPGGETPGAAYERNLADIEGEQARMRAEHPIATRVGEVGADIATILLGRQPVRGLINRFERRAGRETVERAGSLAEDVGRAFQSAPVQRLARGAGRSVETGLEAAILESVKGDDPLETAAMAAGSQALGSAFIHVATRPKWVAAAAIAGGGLQLLKSATPGGQNYILESIESGFDKVAYGLVLGAASALAGATRYGRGNTNLSEQTASLLNGMALAHRGTVLSLLTDWTKADEQGKTEIEAAISGAANPEYEPETERQREIVDELRTAVPTRGSVSGKIERD